MTETDMATKKKAVRSTAKLATLDDFLGEPLRFSFTLEFAGGANASALVAGAPRHDVRPVGNVPDISL